MKKKNFSNLKLFWNKIKKKSLLIKKKNKFKIKNQKLIN